MNSTGQSRGCDPSSRRRQARGANPDHAPEEHQQQRWLVSYADLVTLLLALFVVLYAAADRDRAREVAAAVSQQFGTVPAGGDGVLPGASQIIPGDSLAGERRKLESAFATNDALRTRARLNVTERGLIVSLAEAGFFAEGESEVRTDALPVLEALVASLADSTALMRIEGHTDATPIATARYPSNWELSAARASAVLAYFAARGHLASRLSVAGYAGERPVADNSTPEGRALNRRVDLVVLREGD